MPESYDLTKLEPNSFEHLVNMLALRVLGSGHTGFGPGSDGGRDGYFEGEAPYPSEVEHWSGRWYIQSKFLKPNLSVNPQRWLLDRIKEEIEEFTKSDTKRIWPDNWIIATNIDPSGAPETGSFDRANKLVATANPSLKGHFHIWGGRKILDLLNNHPEVAEYYSQFLTPGHVLTSLFEHIKDRNAELRTILHYLIIKQFDTQQFSKLEQAGSKADMRPGIHRLFMDLPFRANEYDLNGYAIEYLRRAAARNQRIDDEQPDTKDWLLWHRHPSRARVWFVKGGPGQGKSTIGQYFCQIQRAALILQKEGLIIPRHLRTLANEIKRVTEAAGVWPDVPRIPISIELKDFAQWFGERKKSEARGILTYLAERITANVEQDVLVGTLKRALQTRSWFIVFDGLDEVPNDVKDAVALEVRNFVDGVVLENSADVLTLCTSRPQGYSGQFSDLDGPTIDLINLSPAQALQCAKPVLELNRPEEESKKYFQTLKSAIDSTSVRELMTTPLQSHIMAIVVRGGGKPPERRWQLFTNFYDVIRNREADRDLPNSKLARLLREDEKLLKAVHNILGFTLHERAETSEGAQTRLHRKEFEALVTTVATLMIERNIEETIAVLMEATTERLVLVSTPDDGDHVRFDIRQLQEFFAAEFFYETVDADKLRQRMEVVAGDSHWREVMHFLLSALVENTRLTDLAVAVRVLESLNEGDETLADRLISRRLGRGAILAAQLLQEGVFEQDKRFRQQFRKCIEPLTGSTDKETLKPLLKVSQSNSRSWLINFLIDSLKEADQTENIGAAIVLTQILNDNDKTDEVKALLLASSSEYISWVLTSTGDTYSRSNQEKPPLPIWLINTCLELLLSPQWETLTQSGIWAALRILRYDQSKVLFVAKELLQSENQVKLLELIMNEERLNFKNAIVSDFGVLKATRYLSDELLNHAFSNWNVELENELSKAPGILNIAYRVLRFERTRVVSDFYPLLNNSLKLRLLTSTSFYFRTLFSVDISSLSPEETEILKSFDQEQVEVLIKGGKARGRKWPRTFADFSLGKSCSLDQWQNLLENLPDIAVHLWSDRFWDALVAQTKPATLSAEEAANSLINKVIEIPLLLIKHIPLWGAIIKLNLEHESKLRIAILKACSSSDPTLFHSNFDGEELEPFKLNLPVEAPLLPHLVSFLLPTLESVRKVDSEKNIIDIRRTIGTHINDLSALTKIIENPDILKSIRGAALIMSILHPDGTTQILEVKKRFIDFYPTGLGSWYLNLIVNLLGLLMPKETKETRYFLGELFNLVRSDFEGRQQLERMLTFWREQSSAPIQKKNKVELWYPIM